MRNKIHLVLIFFSYIIHKVYSPSYTHYTRPLKTHQPFLPAATVVLHVLHKLSIINAFAQCIVRITEAIGQKISSACAYSL